MARQQDWTLTIIWKLRFQDFSDHSKNSTSTNNVVFMLNVCVPSGCVESLICSRQKVRTWLIPDLKMGTKYLINFSGRQHFTWAVIIWHWRNSDESCVTLLGKKTLRSSCLVSSPVCLILTPVLFCIFFFLVRNHSWEYNYMLSARNSPSKSSNLGMGFGNPLPYLCLNQPLGSRSIKWNLPTRKSGSQTWYDQIYQI